MNETKVVNLHHSPYDVLIDRTTPLGNPFKIGVHGDRSQVIAKHLKWARNLIRQDGYFRSLVYNLDGKVMGCHCKPLPCHGDNYIILIKEIKEGKL